VPPLHLTEVRVGLARQNAQEARLPGSVEAEDQKALAAPDVETDIFEHRRTPVALAEARHLQRGDSARRRIWEPDPKRPRPVTRANPVGLETGDPPLHVVRHGGLRRLRAEPVDHPLHAGDLALLLSSGAGATSLVLRPRRHVLGVGAAVLDDRSGVGLTGAVEMEDPGDGLVE